MRTRIAIVCDAQPERNGVGSYYRDLADHLLTAGLPIDFLAPDSGAAPLPHWLRLPLPGDRTQRLSVPAPHALRQRLHTFRPATVVIATPGPYGLLAAHYGAALGARTVFGLHTDYAALSTLYWGGVRARLNRWGFGAVNRHLLRRAAEVVAISPRMQALAASAGRPDARLLSTQLAPSFVEAPVTVLAPRLERVLYVGRLAAEKRIEQIIEAAERLPNRRFRIAGEGPLRAVVEHAAARLDNIEYLGWLARDEVRDALDASDLLLLPSAVEAFGTVILEALARGRIALASAGCGIHGWPELAAGVYGFGEDEHPATAIERLAARPADDRRDAARRGREAALAMHARALTEWRTVLGDAPPVELAA